MKKFKNKDTGDIWYAEDKEHIKELLKNPKFEEIKKVDEENLKKNPSQKNKK